MKHVTFDEATLAMLKELRDPVDICDASGKVWGIYCPTDSDPDGPPRSPFSDEELRRRQKQNGGRPLKEILKDLEERHGGTSRPDERAK